MRRAMHWGQIDSRGRSMFRTTLLAIASLGFACSISGMGIAMTNRPSSETVRMTMLPAHWHDLTISEKFATMHASGDLVHAEDDQNLEVNCRRKFVTDPSTGASLSFRYPTRELGSFAFTLAKGDPGVAGQLEVLTSELHPGQRIAVLINPGQFSAGKSVPRELGQKDVRRVARMFRAYNDQCVRSHGRPLQTYMVLARSLP